MPAPLFLSGPCEICGQKTTGRHFGVMSCRACASFFRRASSWKKNRTECKKENCQMLEDGKFQCKACRLKRCFEVGMDVRKFQLNNDLLSSTMGPSKSLATFLGRPTFILCCEPEKASRNIEYIDMTYLVDTALRVFHRDSSFRPFLYNNSLEKLAFTLDEMRLKPADEKLMTIRKMGKAESIFIWEQSFLRAVEWFASFPEFNELEDYVKLEIVKAAWIGWTRLEKLAQTADFQRQMVLAKNVYMLGNDTCLDFGAFEFDLSWCTNYSLQQLEFFISPSLEQYCNQCIQDLVDLAPSNIELNYMLLQISLYHAGKKCQGKVLEACDNLMQSQADHLHDYYVNTVKQPHYSARLTNMLKINKGIEADMRDRAERNKLAKMFNVLKIEFSHPDMFDAN